MTTEIVRRVREGILSETVNAWHHKGEGAGEPGGRTYAVLYAPDGRIRIDVSGSWSSDYHTVWLSPEETRPQEEYIDHLIATGKHHFARAYCQHCGLEKPEGRQGFCPDGCRDIVEY